MISKRGDFFVLGMSDNTKGVHLRQVHPLNNLYNKSVCEKILHICQFCRNPQIIRTIKAGR